MSVIMFFFLLGFAVGFVPMFFQCRWLQRFHNERVDYWWRECIKARESADAYFLKWTDALSEKRDDGDEWKQ